MTETAGLNVLYTATAPATGDGDAARSLVSATVGN
jgi:hypothetical protein